MAKARSRPTVVLPDRFKRLTAKDLPTRRLRRAVARLFPVQPLNGGRPRCRVAYEKRNGDVVVCTRHRGHGDDFHVEHDRGKLHLPLACWPVKNAERADEAPSADAAQVTDRDPLKVDECLEVLEFTTFEHRPAARMLVQANFPKGNFLKGATLLDDCCPDTYRPATGQPRPLYFCSRARGHDGAHVAYASSDEPLAAWPAKPYADPSKKPEVRPDSLYLSIAHNAAVQRDITHRFPANPNMAMHCGAVIEDADNPRLAHRCTRSVHVLGPHVTHTPPAHTTPLTALGMWFSSKAPEPTLVAPESIRKHLGQPIALEMLDGRAKAVAVRLGYPPVGVGESACRLRGSGDLPFRCTRPVNHEGPHVAHADGSALAWWPQEEPGRPPVPVGLHEHDEIRSILPTYPFLPAESLKEFDMMPGHTGAQYDPRLAQENARREHAQGVQDRLRKDSDHVSGRGGTVGPANATLATMQLPSALELLHEELALLEKMADALHERLSGVLSIPTAPPGAGLGQPSAIVPHQPYLVERVASAIDRVRASQDRLRDTMNRLLL